MTAQSAPRKTQQPSPLLEVTGLCVTFAADASAGRREHRAVREVDLTLARGESLALVGASGSGKSLTASALIGLEPAHATVRGSVRLDGKEILGLPDRELSRLRGRRVAMVFQDPLASLTPVMTVGRQIAEALRIHRPVRRRAALLRAVELLDRVGIPDAARRIAAYPHEFSGGMRQRVAIAMAIANDPELLIADEPTSALDATVQAQILELLDELREDSGCALLLITHDLGVVARSCDRVAVMRDGALVQSGDVRPLLSADAPTGHLGKLLAASRASGRSSPYASGNAGREVLRVEGLSRHYESRSGFPARRRSAVRAVDGVSFTVAEGEALALLGESGCGKTTTLMEILRLRPPQDGRIEVLGQDLAALTPQTRRELRPQVQVVFQDPSASLNPLLSVADIIGEPLTLQGMRGDERALRVQQLLHEVELPQRALQVRPNRLSGGQRQRVAIARALATRPRLVLLDEPVSALDAPLRAEVMELLDGLRARRKLSYLLVSHDIHLVRRSADHVAVLYRGKVVESGPAEDVLEKPQHPYTRALLDAAPSTDPEAERRRRRVLLHGDVQARPASPQGCAFQPRCPLFAALDASERRACTEEAPAPRQVRSGGAHMAACHFTENECHSVISSRSIGALHPSQQELGPAPS